MNLDLARWQFAITTVYHFLFVPLTIGLSLLVAGMQTAWVRTDDDRYLRMTKFWGKLFLINFAMGVVTGIVQEFQFGMNWSDYSRFVGDIFGAPLAIEGLLAFFLESTFLGLWIFGWDRLPRRLHLACIWMASIGTVASAYFILAANSWMQHPVGSVVNTARGRAELTDFGAVLTNPTAVGAFTHTITACFVTAGMFVLAISAWHLARGRRTEGRLPGPSIDTEGRLPGPSIDTEGRSAGPSIDTEARSAGPSIDTEGRSAGPSIDTDVFRPSLRIALVTVLIASIGVVFTGDLQARLMTQQQPMKMAAAEALYDTTAPASFSLFTIGSLDGSTEVWSLRVPGVLSFMATGSFDGTVEGIHQVQAQEAATFGPGDYAPVIPMTYWTFRLMIGFGLLAGLLSLVGLWLTRRRATRPVPRWYYRAAVAGLLLPFAANSVGWIFTEMGRQPWSVYGVLRTADGVSPSVSTGMVLTSLIVFTLLYGVLAVVDGVLMVRYAKAGPPPPTPVEPVTDEPRPLAVAY